MVEVLGLYGMRVEIDAAEVDDPGERRGVPDHDLLGRRPGGVVQLGDLDPLRALGRRALLEDRFLGDALDETLEDHGPADDATQRPVGDGEVVVDEVELGQAAGREHDADPGWSIGHLAPGHLQRHGTGSFGARGHTLVMPPLSLAT